MERDQGRDLVRPQWEYLTIKKVDFQLSDEGLSVHGREGWELIQVTKSEVGGFREYQYYFKRPALLGH